MRVVITGATGNLGTSLVAALAERSEVKEIVGLSRRAPPRELAKAQHVEADVTTSDLHPLFRGADCVVHLAWRIQPSHDAAELVRTNVHGSARVFEAAIATRVPALVHASSVAAYQPGNGQEEVDESWPVTGIASSSYARQKAEVERLLDGVEKQRPELRVVRFRPALVFKRAAASEILRYFGGPLARGFLFDRRLLRFVPNHPELAFQCVHSHDVAEAFARAVVGNARGAFNLAAEPVLTGTRLAEAFEAKKLAVSRPLFRGLADVTWRMHLQPVDAGWVDLAFDAPLMSCQRARRELGWEPRHDALETLRDLREGMRDEAGMDTPPLEPRNGRPKSKTRRRQVLAALRSQP